QTLFREGDKDGDGLLDYGTLAELSAANLIDPVLGSGIKQGYRFKVLVSPQDPEFLWMATAEPVQRPTTGDRCFAINQSGLIYFAQQPIPLPADCSLPSWATTIGGAPGGRAGAEDAKPMFGGAAGGAPPPPTAGAPE